MKTFKVIGEKGSKSMWYTGYAMTTIIEEGLIIEVQRWSYWCKKFGVAKAGNFVMRGTIRRVGGIYTDLSKSYNVKKLKKELLFEKRQRRIDNKVC